MEVPDGPIDLPSDFRISAVFSPKAYTKMRRQFLKSYGLDILAFDRVHPLVVSSLLSQRVLAAEHAVSLDERLMEMARASGIPVTGLETLHEQVQVLERIDPAAVCRQLKRLASRPWALRRQTEASLAAYLRGDLRGLYRRSRRSLHGLRDLVLKDRNRRMVRRLVELDHGRTYFIAVGAAHLAGRDGLLVALRRLGWMVNPVDIGPDPID